MFGRHLVRKGLLTEEQLLLALERQHGVKISIGRLAFERDLLNLDQVMEVLEEQRRRGEGRFGDLAVEMGLLRPEDRDACRPRRALPWAR